MGIPRGHWKVEAGVDAELHGAENLAFGFLLVDARALAGKAHAAKAENGDGLALSVLAVQHGGSASFEQVTGIIAYPPRR